MFPALVQLLCEFPFVSSGEGQWTLPGSADVDFVDLSCILEGRYHEEDTWIQIWHKADGTYYLWAHEEFVLTASFRCVNA